MTAVDVQDLVDEPALRLVPRTSHCRTTGRGVRWVATTELPDPMPFLRGGELVMTTGLHERSDAEWRDVVSALARLPIAALCFGTGLVHREVPEVVVRTAEERGVPLVESPREVPFIQISRWVADQLFAERYRAVRTTVAVQDDLVRALLAGDDLGGLLRKLHARVRGGAVAVLGADGDVLAQHPEGAAGSTAVTGPVRFPVTVDGVVVAHVCAESSIHEAVLSFAANVLGLELARRQAELTGRRELLGHVVEDVVQQVISDREARQRLRRWHVPLDEPIHVVLATVAGSADRLRRLPWALAQLAERRDDRFPTAVVDGTAVLLVPERAELDRVTADLHRQLSTLDPQVGIGVSLARPGVRGLRIGHAEARQACDQGPGVRSVDPLSMTGLLLGSADLPLRDLAEAALDPLTRHDAEHRSDLVLTLRAYLAHDCSPSAAADALAVHRNGLRYRLRQIEELTARDLSRMPDRIELWFALAATGNDPGEQVSRGAGGGPSRPAGSRSSPRRSG